MALALAFICRLAASGWLAGGDRDAEGGVRVRAPCAWRGGDKPGVPFRDKRRAVRLITTRGVRTGLLDGERKGFISGSAGLRDKGGAAWSC